MSRHQHIAERQVLDASHQKFCVDTSHQKTVDVRHQEAPVRSLFGVFSIYYLAFSYYAQFIARYFLEVVGIVVHSFYFFLKSTVILFKKKYPSFILFPFGFELLQLGVSRQKKNREQRTDYN